MRLIDADALKETFENTEDAEYCKWSLYGITSEIDDAPTVCDIEQYAKEHNLFICTTNIIEHIRAEIEKHTDGNNHCDEYIDGYNNGMKDALEIIDKYTKGESK